MRMLPPTRSGKIRLCAMTAGLFGLALFYRPDRFALAMLYDKREGDIVFQSLPRNDLADAIEGISESHWSHCGVLVRDGEDWMVAEAIGDVHLTPLKKWVLRGRHCRFAAYRVTTMQEADVPRLRAALNAMVGRQYDFSYAPDDSEIYCSELVFRAFERGVGIKLGAWQELRELNWGPFEDFVRSMENGALPLERQMITPVALTRSPLVHRVVQW